MEEMTEKQASFIEVIKEVLGIEFKGTTKDEATQFIGQNIKSFKNQQELNSLDNWNLKYI